MNIKQVDPGIYRGPSPASKEDWEQLQALGIKYTLDLQTDSPIDGEPSLEQQIAELHGMKFISNPLSELKPPSKADLDFCFRTMMGSKPIYVHCLAGVDRTGMVCANYRIKKNGWSKKDAVAEMWANGFHFWYFWWVWFL